jgi:hypothetical protein
VSDKPESLQFDKNEPVFGTDTKDEPNVVIFTIPIGKWSQMDAQDGAALIKGWFDNAKGYALQELQKVHMARAKKTAILQPVKQAPVKLTVQ